MRIKTAVVLGGGVAGLAAATLLSQRGVAVRLLEQAPAITEVGAGLQISPNGVAVLRAMGLGGQVAARAVCARAVELRRAADGGLVTRLDLSAYDRARPDAARGAAAPGKAVLNTRASSGFALGDAGPDDAGSSDAGRSDAGRSETGRSETAGQGGFYFFHRADLVAMLADHARAAGVEIVLNACAVSVTPGAPATVQLADGTTEQADLVVGADGLRSVTRAAVGPAAPAAFTGQVAWRAVVPASAGDAAPVAQVFMGPGRHLVSYPLRGGQQRNIVAVEERQGWTAEGWHQSDSAANLCAAFAGFGGPVPGWLAQVTQVHLWGLFRHPVAPCWGAEGVAILGDAAHPTLPFMAQGANMALEDAWVLAGALAGALTWGEGVAAFQVARRARVVRVVDAATTNARLYHLRGPVALAAHAALRLGGTLAPGAALRRYDWIYGHDVTAP
ncbi:FAD-dependent monooxygenase [Roseicitreum antarcticum]|uniref:FAD binding domain-containing protein n=1 Tax=Roseicitreum antarcticum TaxID=564137 RepID=A0A1H2TV58_9RHOB|nr:FAD-dependent monooxygenase [Roseicitreum antarcticum]SDW47856.1 FAD binding domain-containing protein [Roseicitreum antarcticum]